MIINGDGGYGLLAAYVADLWPKPVGLVQRSAATWQRLYLLREPSELSLLWWRHCKYRRGYYYYYYNVIHLSVCSLWLNDDTSYSNSDCTSEYEIPPRNTIQLSSFNPLNIASSPSLLTFKQCLKTNLFHHSRLIPRSYLLTDPAHSGPSSSCFLLRSKIRLID